MRQGNDDENPLKELHHVIFARAGKWSEVGLLAAACCLLLAAACCVTAAHVQVRKNLLDFSGVDPSVADAETEKIAERLGRRKLDAVKDIAR